MPSPATTLTARQQQVAELVAHSCTNTQIATALRLSERQVERHVTDIATAWNLDRTKNLRVQITLCVWKVA